MEAASGRNLTQFRRWYAQAGTPRLRVRGSHNPRARAYTLTVAQSTPPTPGQPDKQPLDIPLALGLLDPAGAPLPLRLKGEGAPASSTRVLELSKAEQRFTFTDVPERPVPSLLRGFSAPVILESDAEDADWRFLMAHDPDPFVRWESGQSYALKVMLGQIAEHRAGRALRLDDGLVDAFAGTLDETTLDHEFVAQALTLPSETYVAEQMAEIDVDGIHAVRESLRAGLGERLGDTWLEIYRTLQAKEPYRFEAAQVGRRTLKNLALAYLLAGGAETGRRTCLAQYRGADNMTDTIAALGLLAESDLPERAEALADFYARWRDDALVVDKWFALQATAQRPDALDAVSALLHHEAFTLANPNRVRSLIGAFAQANPTGFHRADGAGYAFVADHVLALDKRNPQVASRLAQPFGRWRRHDAQRQEHMRAQLERILATAGLSRDVYEIASKSLM
jgi:aminopeptidase N